MKFDFSLCFVLIQFLPFVNAYSRLPGACSCGTILAFKTLYWWNSHQYSILKTPTYSLWGYRYPLSFAYIGGIPTNIGFWKHIYTFQIKPIVRLHSRLLYWLPGITRQCTCLISDFWFCTHPISSLCKWPKSCSAGWWGQIPSGLLCPQVRPFCQQRLSCCLLSDVVFSMIILAVLNWYCREDVKNRCWICLLPIDRSRPS